MVDDILRLRHAGGVIPSVLVGASRGKRAPLLTTPRSVPSRRWSAVWAHGFRAGPQHRPLDDLRWPVGMGTWILRGPSAPTSRRFAPAAIATLGRHAARAAPQEHLNILEVNPLAIPRSKDLGLEPQGFADPASENVEENPKNLTAAMLTSLRSHVPKARD